MRDLGGDQGHSPQQGIDALQRFDTAHEKDNAPRGWQPQRALGFLRRDRVEETEVDAAGYDGDLGRICAVEPNHLRPFQGRSRNQQVGAVHHFCFALDAALRFPLVGAVGHAVLHLAERVKHLEDRYSPGAAQFAGSQAGEPVVAVDHVVLHAFPPGKVQHAAHKLGDMIGYPVLVVGGLRPGRYVDHAGLWPEPMADTGDVRILRAGETVDRHPLPAQFTAQVADIDIHAPCLFAAEGR